MRKGFTLIELIVVIAIIAVLAAIVAPNAFKAIEKGKISAAVADVKSIQTASMAFYADTGTWPTDGITDSSAENGFIEDLDGNGNAIPGWDGPYLEKWPAQNAWGGSYIWGSNAGSWDAAADPNNERYVVITEVTEDGAEKMQERIDGDSDQNAGAIEYSAINTAFKGVPASTAGRVHVGMLIADE